MRYGQGISSILVVAAGLLVIGVGVHAADGGALPAASGSPSPAASPSAETTATPGPVLPPSDAGTVRRALRKRTAAVAAWREWNRARRCLALRVVPFHKSSARRPLRAEPGTRWLAAGRSWKHDRGVYRARVAHLVYHMKHPGGSSNGVRWLPLAKWLHWPRYALSQLAHIIMGESSGRERADNGVGYVGLVQFAWKWAHGVYLIHGRPRFFNRADATETLIAARDVWEDQGHSFLPAWSLTAY